MHNGRIVILADLRDGHLPFVLPHLREEPLIIDTGRILEGDHLSYRTTGLHTGPEVVYKGEIVGPARSVWFRALSSERIMEARPVAAKARQALGESTAATANLHKLIHDLLGDPENLYWSKGVPVEDVMQLYAASSLNRLAGAIAHMFPEALWVSPRDTIAKAMHKPYQMVVAQKVGLPVPRTLFTSDPKEASAFLEYHGTCVVKPLALNAPPGMNQYTQKLRWRDRPDFSGLWANPHIFQEVVIPAYEVRLTLIGSAVFAATVADYHHEALAADRTVRDWRLAFERGTFIANKIDPPERVTSACIQFVRHYGLKTGMFDFIVDKSGRWMFLENNPNGAWGFIEETTGHLIGKTLARMLQEANHYA